jgi:N-acetylglucosamine kinase-like BadF-type ATPase
MSSFWLSKKVLLEALKMVEGQPQTSWVSFEGKSEVKNDKEYTVTTINANGKKKTIKQEFDKILFV